MTSTAAAGRGVIFDGQGGPLAAVLPLPPVDLPPAPATSPRRERGASLTGRAVVSLALLVGALGLAVGVIAALVGLNVLAWRAGRIHIGLVVAAGAVILALGRAVVAMVRRPEGPADEVEVSPAHQPQLFALVGELAETAGVRPPDRIALVAEVNAYVWESTALLGLVPGRRTLAIGAPLFDVLSVSQLRAVLAHELGHFAGGDTRLGALTFRTDQALGRIVESLGGGWIRSLFLAYWKLKLRLSAKISRGQELAADHAAVAAAGRQAAADALLRIEVASRGEALLRDAYLVPLLQAGRRPDDIGGGLRSLLSEPLRVAELVRGDGTAGGATHPWATHPPTPERIAQVASLPEAPSVSNDPRPASVLLHDALHWCAAAHDRWLTVVTGGAAMPPASWDDFGEAVLEEMQTGQAAAVDDALARLGLPAGLAGVREARGRGLQRELAAGLIASGWRTGTPDERDLVLQAAERAVVGREVTARHGYRWALSWSGPAALTDGAGGVVELDALVERVLNPNADGDGAADSEPAHAGAVGAGAPAPAAPVGAAGSVGAVPLPPAPSPPFVALDGDWSWMVELPGNLGRKRRVAVGELALAFDAHVFPYTAIEAMTFKTKGDDLSKTAEISVVVGGKREKLSWSANATKTWESIITAVAYVYDVAAAKVGARLLEAAAGELRRGGSFRIGDLVLTVAGVAHKRRPERVIPWAEVPDAQFAGDKVVITPASGKALSVSLTDDNGFLLGQAIPYLRALFA